MIGLFQRQLSVCLHLYLQASRLPSSSFSLESDGKLEHKNPAPPIYQRLQISSITMIVCEADALGSVSQQSASHEGG